jgi:hypothetical protein
MPGYCNLIDKILYDFNTLLNLKIDETLEINFKQSKNRNDTIKLKRVS